MLGRAARTTLAANVIYTTSQSSPVDESTKRTKTCAIYRMPSTTSPKSCVANTALATTQAARSGGRITVCGATSGPNPPAALHRIWWKQLSILGSTMGTMDDFEGAYDLIASGRARPVVDQVFPLAEARAAHEHLESGRQFGKVVLRMPE